MKIKDYKCKCGHNDFFFADKGNQKGIYCTYCGKWLKWADKDEQNLTLKQEPILDKIFSIVHPLSIMSTDKMEHEAIMKIAEMLEPLCLAESEDEK